VVTDPYTTAKAGLRDNVKTLVAVFGGVAGVLLAGTPFSGYGALALFGTRWWVASIALLVALALLGLCVWRLLFILRPDLSYTSLLTDPPPDAEVAALQAEFERHKAQLLPRARPPQRPIDTVADLVAAKSEAWRRYQLEPASEARRLAHERLADALAALNHWSGFTRLHLRVSRGVRDVLLIGVLAMLGIAVFVLAVASQQDAGAPPASITVIAARDPASGAAPLAPLQPVLFATGQDELSAEGLARVAAALQRLREQADAGLLILAHADTIGSEAANHELAARRAARVRQALQVQGGVSAARLFVAVLGARDLPVLTTPHASAAANRAVELQLVALPPRPAASAP
jgi:outer membrane protein OmpA-like peptidoglycan-associated protein